MAGGFVEAAFGQGHFGEFNAVKPHQARRRSNPQVAILRLLDDGHRTIGQAVRLAPGANGEVPQFRAKIIAPARKRSKNQRQRHE
jgi:hypothetical protein